MHHNPAKNVLCIKTSPEEIAQRLKIPETRWPHCCARRKKMYAARLLRPTPYVTKTIYVGWNAMRVGVSGAAKGAGSPNARILPCARSTTALEDAAQRGMRHVMRTRIPRRAARDAGVLDDYASR